MESGLPLEAEAEYLYNDSFQRVFAYWSITHTSREYDNDSRTATIYLPGGEVLTELIRGPGAPVSETAANVGAGSGRREDRDWSEEAYHYQFTDHLGSTRFVAGTSWGTGETWLETDTWLRPVNLTPYGSELRDPSARYTPDSLLLFDPILFTGKPKDIESGLTFFGARYYNDQLCRWIGADDPFADSFIQKPQSWNLYLYVRNDPVNNADPDGSGTLEGIAEGGLDFAKSAGAGVLESYKALALGPLYLAYTGYQTTAATGQAWLTQEGRDRMSNTWEKMGSTGQVAVQTNLALQCIATALTAYGASNSSATAAAAPAPAAESAVKAPIPAMVYRKGGKSPSNLTPRPIDQGMLSTRDSLSNPWPLQPGEKAPLPAGQQIQVIDTSQLL